MMTRGALNAKQSDANKGTMIGKLVGHDNIYAILLPEDLRCVHCYILPP